MATRPGWRLVLRCITCEREAVFEGYLLTLAADTAEHAGWEVDRDALHAAVDERYALCPNH